MGGTFDNVDACFAQLCEYAGFGWKAWLCGVGVSYCAYYWVLKDQPAEPLLVWWTAF